METTPKPFVFVLMPFAPEFDDTYKLGIKTACEGAGTYCERLDEQLFKERMLDRIYNQISKADLLVADMTGRNPNVFYEVGYAHALGKYVILLTRDAGDIPFDLRHHRHIVYSNISSLIAELSPQVKHFAFQRGAGVGGGEPEVYLLGHRLQQSADVNYFQIEPRLEKSKILLDLPFTFHNPNFEHVKLRHALYLRSEGLAPGSWGELKFTRDIRLPDGNILVKPDSPIELPPGDWEERTYSVRYVGRKPEEPELLVAELQVAHRGPIAKYPLNLTFES